MGTRINVLFDREGIDWTDRGSILRRLGVALPAALAVRDYWLAADPQSPHDNLAVWREDPLSPRDPYLHRYTGPGNLFLTVMAQAAHLRTGGRWRGFLSIEPLRRVHLPAFRQIAVAFGSRRMAMYADSCEIDDLFWAGRSQSDAVEWMEQIWGPPQSSVEALDPRIAAAERSVPPVWFLESIAEEERGGRT